MGTILHAITIAAPHGTVYALVANARGFRQWWATDVTERGDTVELGFFKRTTIYKLRLTANQPGTHADWICETGSEWIGTHIVFDIQASGSGTLLRFAHSGWRSETDFFVTCNTTWGELMFRLKAAAEGRSRGPLFLDDGMA